MTERARDVFRVAAAVNFIDMVSCESVSPMLKKLRKSEQNENDIKNWKHEKIHNEFLYTSLYFSFRLATCACISPSTPEAYIIFKVNCL